jgi:hypothetical protein
MDVVTCIHTHVTTLLPIATHMEVSTMIHCGYRGTPVPVPVPVDTRGDTTCGRAAPSEPLVFEPWSKPVVDILVFVPLDALGCTILACTDGDVDVDVDVVGVPLPLGECVMVTLIEADVVTLTDMDGDPEIDTVPVGVIVVAGVIVCVVVCVLVGEWEGVALDVCVVLEEWLLLTLLLILLEGVTECDGVGELEAGTNGLNVMLKAPPLPSPTRASTYISCNMTCCVFSNRMCK